MTPDELAIRDAHVRWIGAVNSADLDGLLALMTDDAVFLNPGQAPIGRDDFGPRFRDGHRRNRIACVSEPQEVEVVGDIAFTRCRDSLSVEPRDGSAPMALAGDRLTIYRRQADGRWLLARDAHTLTATPR
jgi:uncharacterized protein (TIGR02246 family)